MFYIRYYMLYNVYIYICILICRTYIYIYIYTLYIMYNIYIYICISQFSCLRPGQLAKRLKELQLFSGHPPVAQGSQDLQREFRV